METLAQSTLNQGCDLRQHAEINAGQKLEQHCEHAEAVLRLQAVAFRYDD